MEEVDKGCKYQEYLNVYNVRPDSSQNINLKVLIKTDLGIIMGNAHCPGHV